MIENVKEGYNGGKYLKNKLGNLSKQDGSQFAKVNKKEFKPQLKNPEVKESFKELPLYFLVLKMRLWNTKREK